MIKYRAFCERKMSEVYKIYEKKYSLRYIKQAAKTLKLYHLQQFYFIKIDIIYDTTKPKQP